MLRLVPEERWEEYIAHLVQSRLRSGLSDEVQFLFQYDQTAGQHWLAVKALTEKSLIAPYDIKRWKKFFKPYNNDLFGKPIPHLLCIHGATSQLCSVAMEAAKRLLGEEEFPKWVSAKDEAGKDCIQDILVRRTYWTEVRKKELMNLVGIQHPIPVDDSFGTQLI